MKRFYLIHESAWDAPVQFFYAKGQLSQAFEGKACTWWNLPDGHRIVVGDFRAEDREDAWNSHPATVHLHHPVKEPDRPLGDLLKPDQAYKRFTSAHMQLLSAAVGATEADTLVTLNQKMATVHPGCTIYPIAKPSARWLY